MTSTERSAAIPPEVIRRVHALLCDADGNLFPSEEPAFAVSAEVTNAFLAHLGVTRQRTGEELRLATTGMTFRRTALALAAEHGIAEVGDLEAWVEQEKTAVTAHLRATLRPDPGVVVALTALQEHLDLAAVSSSAMARLQGCFAATGLTSLIPSDRIFSAEDSLTTPTSKPDPAIYRHACEQMGIPPEAGLAVEDSLPGAHSAIAAGCPTVGNVLFVPLAERPQRVAALHDAGVIAVVASWAELAELLLPTLCDLAADRLVPAGDVR